MAICTLRSLLLFVFLAWLQLNAAYGAFKDNYSHQQYLDLNKKYLLQWTTDQKKGEIHIAVVVETTGWVGLGITTGTSGQMKGADLVMGYVSSDGVGYIRDSHGVGNQLPVKDPQQDYILTGSAEKDGKTTIQFTRKLIMCDENDISIKGATKVLFAYNDKDATPGDETSYGYHGAANRGAKTIHFLSNPATEKIPPGTPFFDMTAKRVAVPSRHTSYWCIVVADLKTKLKGRKQVIQIDPMVQTGNEPYVHHVSIWRCPKKISKSSANFSGDCFGAGTPSEVTNCAGASFIFGWAIGGGPIGFPAHISLPFPDEDEDFVMQTHYNNPTNVAGVIDSSGFRFYYQNTARKYEAGIFRLGLTFRTSILVPPKQESWTIGSYCDKGCIKPDNATANLGFKVKLFRGAWHQHLSGTGGWTTLVRNGKEIQEVLSERNFDFNSHAMQEFENEIEIGADDEFITYCMFNTKDRTVATMGGYATTDEMCTNTMYYYPKQIFNECTSKTLDLIPFSEKYAKPVNNSEDGAVNPYNWSNVTWTDGMVKELRDIYDQKMTTVRCISFDSIKGGTRKTWNATKVTIDTPLPKDGSCVAKAGSIKHSASLGSMMIACVVATILGLLV